MSYFNYNLIFKNKTSEDIYHEIRGRLDDVEYLLEAKKRLLGRGKWYGNALIDLIDAKLEIMKLKEKIISAGVSID
jgi:hypothetical protein